MDSSLHSHLAGLYIRDRIAEATTARLAREARPPRRLTPTGARRGLWRPRRRVAAMRPDPIA